MVASAPVASDQLREDAARLAQGEVGEAAETWAALLTDGPAADHIGEAAHLVLTDLDELRALASDLDIQADDRRDGLVASGELPPDWPLPYDAGGTLEELTAAAAEVLEEQATRRPASAPRRRCQAGPTAPERGSWSWPPLDAPSWSPPTRPAASVSCWKRPVGRADRRRSCAACRAPERSAWCTAR